MITFLLILHLFIALVLIGIILLQRSEGGGLGIGGSNMDNLLNVRGGSDFMSKATTILAVLFISSSIFLTLLMGGKTEDSLIDTIETEIVPNVPLESTPEKLAPIDDKARPLAPLER